MSPSNMGDTSQLIQNNEVPIKSMGSQVIQLILTAIQAFFPILLIIVTVIVIIYDVKSKASTKKKTIISIVAIGSVVILYIITIIMKVVLHVNRGI